MNPLISVIVPVYKVEKYLDRCITSIVEQTYENLEIILVDDGSPDNSGKMCDDWAKKDNRIKVFHKENGGPAETRNLGVEKATGKYISFVDSDDYILPDYIETLYKDLADNNADISCCNYFNVWDTDRLTSLDENNSSTELTILTGRESCYDSIGDERWNYVIVWGKIFKASIVKQHKFPIGRLCEDAAITCYYFYPCNKITITSKKLYAHYINNGGIMQTVNPKRRVDEPWSMTERAKFYKEHSERELEIAEWGYVITIYILAALQDKKRLSPQAFKFAKEHWFNGDLSRKTKLKFLLCAISPKLYQKTIDQIGKSL